MHVKFLARALFDTMGKHIPLIKLCKWFCIAEKQVLIDGPIIPPQGGKLKAVCMAGSILRKGFTILSLHDKHSLWNTQHSPSTIWVLCFSDLFSECRNKASAFCTSCHSINIGNPSLHAHYNCLIFLLENKLVVQLAYKQDNVKVNRACFDCPWWVCVASFNRYTAFFSVSSIPDEEERSMSAVSIRSLRDQKIERQVSNNRLHCM